MDVSDGAVSVNPKYLKALLHVAAVNDIRFYLNGVLFEATEEGKVYVATDGHRLALFHEAWGIETSREMKLIIPRDVIEQMRTIKPKPMVKVNALLRPMGDRWNLDSHTTASLTFRAIDGKFPDWRRVVPQKVTPAEGNYQWRYVEAMQRVVREGLGETNAVTLWQNGENEAAVVTARISDNFLGVIMPLRAHKGVFNPPKWARIPEPTPEPTPAPEAVAEPVPG